MKEGPASVVLQSGETLEGNFESDKLEGLVVETLSIGDTESVRREVIYRAGVRHGLYRETRGGQLWTLGTLLDGEKAGPAWVRLRGDAFYMGELDAEINIQDEHGLCLYLYPDLVTLMVGEFSHGRLVSGHLSFVLLRLLSEAKMNE